MVMNSNVAFAGAKARNVTDSRGGVALQSFTVSSSSINQPPVITSTPVKDANGIWKTWADKLEKALKAGKLRGIATETPFPDAIAGPGVTASVPTYEAPIRGPETVLDRLLRLDSWAQSGLSESEFNRLFAKCRCGLIMTCRVFRGHICAVAVGIMQKKPEVIDLTLDEGDNFVRERSSQLNVIDLGCFASSGKHGFGAGSVSDLVTGECYTALQSPIVAIVFSS